MKFRYFLLQAFEAAFTLAVLVSFTFFLLHMAPGGPFDSDQAWPAEIKEQILKKYGLDQPLITQWWSWMKDALQGDLKESFYYIGTPVVDILKKTSVISATLGLWSLLISVAVGIPLGTWCAWKADTKLCHFLDGVWIVFLSLPSYLTASLLVLTFSIWLGWLPPALWEDPTSLILPVATLACRPLAILARMTKVTVSEILAGDFIRTAYAKGLSFPRVLFKHALNNAWVPILTSLGPLAAHLVTGSFIVELVFQLPGLGKYFVQSMINRDYPVVMGVTLEYGIILIGVNFLVELTYPYFDPRLR